MKNWHEIRDPIHTFIVVDDDERKVIDSRPFQRLRHIHQLAMTYLIYPGATHKRFEHSLGVMELSSRIFDVITRAENIPTEARETIKELSHPDKLSYWRKTLRIAALCHDLGHLPFSHAAEEQLLPKGWTHERLTIEIIKNEISKILENIRPLISTEDVIKLSVGEKELKKAGHNTDFSIWERILSEIITGNSFGSDRMDYLLRDSHHAGVSYGKFDQYRLIDTLRILPIKRKEFSSDCTESEELIDIVIGIEEGGIHSAEALLLARYFMFSQLYLHPVRRIFDQHLQNFLSLWLDNGKFSDDYKQILLITDNEVNAAIIKAAENPDDPAHLPATIINERKHFKTFYSRNPDDLKITHNASELIYNAAVKKFGEAKIKKDKYTKESDVKDFPVKLQENRIVWAKTNSEVLNHIPGVVSDYIFVNPEYREEVRKWLANNKEEIISSEGEHNDR